MLYKKYLLIVVMGIMAMTSIAQEGITLKFGFRWPMGDGTGNDIKVTSLFGYRDDVKLPGFGGDDSAIHPAMDMIPKVGPYTRVAIKATADGEVVICYPAPGGKFRGHPAFGGCLLIRHLVGTIDGQPFYAYSFYAHMKDVWVGEGTRVRQGQAIGLMGNTGQSDGAHLHFAITFNPWDFFVITAAEQDRLIRKAISERRLWDLGH